MTDLLTKVKAALELHESEFAITYDLDELAPDMARALISAENLLDELEVQHTVFGLTPGAAQALAAFRAAMKGRTDD